METKENLSKGITLVALVITIVILLILAGISIQSITNTGLFTNAKRAKDESMKEQLKEEINLAIQSIKTEEIYKGNSVTLETLAEGQLEEALTDITAELDGDKINGEYKNYEYTIDSNFNVTIKEEETEAIYEIISTEGDKKNIIIKIKNNAGINRIIMPNNNNILCHNKDEVSIDYKIKTGEKYEFKIDINNGKEESWNLDSTEIDNITINQNDSYSYPNITDKGIKIKKEISISYTENNNNFYTLDNGKTWSRYEKSINVYQEGEIKAKSLKKYKITPIISEKIILQLSSDALETKCYNDNVNDYGCAGTTQYLLVDKSMYNKKIIVSVGASANAFGDARIYSIDSSGSRNDMVGKIDSRGGKEITITIPENCVKLEFWTQRGNESCFAYIKEITICDEPIIRETKNYPVITDKGIKNLTSKINIDYFSSSIRKMYKIDDGEWEDYNGEITIDVGKKVYAKGIDENNKETRIISSCLTSLANDALETKCYNDNVNDYGCAGTTQYLLVDKSMYNKKIIVSVGASANAFGDARIYSIDSSGSRNDMVGKIDSRGGKEITITIPENCVKLEFWTQRGNESCFAYIKELYM